MAENKSSLKGPKSKKSGSSGASAYYPPVSFHFEVRILEGNDKGGKSSGSGKNADASFQEVSGISAEIPTEDFYEGGENRFTYKLPKPIKYSPLQLKRGLVSSSSVLSEWCKETFEYGFVKSIVVKDVLVKLLDEEGEPLMSWMFIGAYPTKINISSFNAQNNEIVVETLELTYKRFEKVKG